MWEWFWNVLNSIVKKAKNIWRSILNYFKNIFGWEDSNLDVNAKIAAISSKDKKKLLKEYNSLFDQIDFSRTKKVFASIWSDFKTTFPGIKQNILTEVKKLNTELVINEKFTQSKLTGAQGKWAKWRWKIKEDEAKNRKKEEDDKKKKLKAEQDRIKKFNKYLKEKQKERDKQLKEWQKIVQKYYQAVWDWTEKAIDKVKELKNSISELNKELKWETKEKDIAIAERKLEIEEKILELNKKIEENTKKEWEDVTKIAEKRKTLQQELNILRQKESEFTEKTKQSSKDSLALQIQKKNAQLEWLEVWWIENVDLIWELSDLKDELNLVEQNLNKEVFIKVSEDSKKNQTQLLLDQFQEKKAAIEKELAEKKNQLKIEWEIYDKLLKTKMHLEEKFTEFLQIETDKRLDMYEQIAQKAKVAVWELLKIWINSSAKLSEWYWKKIETNYEINIEWWENNAKEIAEEVYKKIEQETEEGNKNIY